MENFLNNIGQSASTAFVDTVFDFGIAILILIVGLFLIKRLTNILKVSKIVLRLDKSVQNFILNLLNIILKALVLFIAAVQIGVPEASIVAVIGSAGLAIGLALQGGLANVAGGFFIMIFRPFSVGDYIKITDYEGTVSDINVFYTTLITPNNQVVTHPNGDLSNGVMINFSKLPTRRVNLTFGVAYDSDIEQIKKIMLDVVNNHPKVLQDPIPEARLLNLGDSSMDFYLRAFCNTDVYFEVKYDIYEQVRIAFDKNNIEIPFPQLDINFNGVNPDIISEVKESKK